MTSHLKSRPIRGPADERRHPAFPGLLAAAAVGVLAPALVAVDLPRTANSLLAAALMVWAPGYCVVVSARIRDWALSALLTVAVSLAVTTAVATALLYAGVWNATSMTVSAGLVTLVLAAVAHLARVEP